MERQRKIFPTLRSVERVEFLAFPVLIVMLYDGGARVGYGSGLCLVYRDT